VKVLPRILRVCNRCSHNYLARQHNSKFCDSCRDYIDGYTSCSKCGGRVSNIIHEKNSGLCTHCFTKGKTYSEIYSRPRSEVRSGFKSGLQNPNYNKEIKERANRSLSLYYKNNPEKLEKKLKKSWETQSKNGFRFYDNQLKCYFNSSYEKEFYNFLISNSIAFTREVRIDLIDNHIKIVDFVLPFDHYKIYVETTGYSYVCDTKNFCNRIDLLRKSIHKEDLILILTDTSLVQDILSHLYQTGLENIYVEDLYNQKLILKKIRLLKLVGYSNYKLLSI
jgi:hypothetical protein